MKHIKTGVVVSDKMDKTRVVRIDWSANSDLYTKTLKRSTKLFVHDPKNLSHTGDKVSIVETKPISNKKRWRIVKVS
jgi:small subunit ribosomal protein S17